MLGRLTRERSVPQLRRFLEAGGTVVTVGTSTVLAESLGLPVSSALVERTPTGGERVLTAEKFYVPGSVLRIAVDSTAPLAAGMPSRVDVFFDNSPTFRLGPDAARRGVRPVAVGEAGAADQHDDGSVPFVIPDALRTSGPAAAPSGHAATIVPWVHYQRTVS
jgi:hypothetical protein